MVGALVTVAAWLGVTFGIAVALAVVWPRKRRR
jgi:hypothetical protein